MARQPPAQETAYHDPGHQDVASRVALAGHPIHAMMVTFPIALVFATLGADVLYWWTADPFFARAARWGAGSGFLMGVAAGLVGAVELLLVPGVRKRSASWSHFVTAMVLLALLGANWTLRFGDFEGAVLPWGLLLSLLSAPVVIMAGWIGGKLVFEHQVGVLLAEDKS